MFGQQSSWCRIRIGVPQMPHISLIAKLLTGLGIMHSSDRISVRSGGHCK